MIPTGAVPADAEFNESEQPSRTYMLDFARGRVSGMVDELEAVKQAVYKALSTDRFFPLHIHDQLRFRSTDQFSGDRAGTLG